MIASLIALVDYGKKTPDGSKKEISPRFEGGQCHGSHDPIPPIYPLNYFIMIGYFPLQ